MIKTQKLNSNGYTFSEIFSAVVAFFAIIFLGLFIFHVTQHTGAKTPVVDKVPPPVTNMAADSTYTPLAPATVPSKVAECHQSLTYSSNGNSGPIQCANGNLNILEWNALAALEPRVMTLGASPTLAQIKHAICADARDSDTDANTNSADVIETTTYEITALYYGWSFPSNPLSALTTPGAC